jgi:hypothetical protein
MDDEAVHSRDFISLSQVCSRAFAVNDGLREEACTEISIDLAIARRSV